MNLARLAIRFDLQVTNHTLRDMSGAAGAMCMVDRAQQGLDSEAELGALSAYHVSLLAQLQQVLQVWSQWWCVFAWWVERSGTWTLPARSRERSRPVGAGHWWYGTAHAAGMTSCSLVEGGRRASWFLCYEKREHACCK